MSDQRDGGISWTDETWNPIRGCSRVSPGCDHCYAMGQAHRFSNEVNGKPGPYQGLTVLRPKTAKRPGVDWSGRVRFVAEMLGDPLRWREPKRVFVNSMSDLFHEGLGHERVAAVFGVMAAAPRHTFQVLTKRPTSASTFFGWAKDNAHPDGGPGPATVCGIMAANHGANVDYLGLPETWPLPNVWIGVSVENRAAKYRIDELRALPAAVRFLSLEPLIEDLGTLDLHGIDWVIVGGESGNGARPFDLGWARSIVEQCARAKVACFVKQMGADPIDGLAGCSVPFASKKGGDINEWPADLRVRQFPEVRRG